MKYQCKECNFQWEGTVNTFEKVREHEKTHLEKQKNNEKKIMSLRCKVCNTLKTSSIRINSDETWECKVCGNLLNAQGNVIVS